LKERQSVSARLTLRAIFAVLLASPLVAAPPANAQESRVSAVSAQEFAYADLADLADPATIVAKVKVTGQQALKPVPVQAGNVRPGWARVLVSGKTQGLLVGQGLGESIRFLADVRMDSRGKLPKLKGQSWLVFANPGQADPRDLRLVAGDALVPATPANEARVRALLSELVAPGAAPRVSGVREAMHVGGNLAGEGETQVFMATERGEPVSLTIVRRPGQAPVWGVSLSEIVDQAARPPARDTLTWYRLACSLPPELPREAVQYGSAEDRRIAVEDYRLVMRELGPCNRTRQ